MKTQEEHSAEMDRRLILSANLLSLVSKHMAHAYKATKAGELELEEYGVAIAVVRINQAILKVNRVIRRAKRTVKIQPIGEPHERK